MNHQDACEIIFHGCVVFQDFISHLRIHSLVTHLLCRNKSGKRQKNSTVGASNVMEFYAAQSLGFGSGSQQDTTVYFEVEFRGVNSQKFDIDALKDICVGIHGTHVHKDEVWTVSWKKGSSGRRLASNVLHVLQEIFSLPPSSHPLFSLSRPLLTCDLFTLPV